jgi:hypothetical protein
LMYLAANTDFTGWSVLIHDVYTPSYLSPLSRVKLKKEVP